MLRRTAIAAGALLGGFHGWLLVNQASSGHLAEPDAVMRWAVALLLVGGLVSVRRRGHSLRGRQGVAMWVLAALLHGPALANDLDGLATPSLPEAVTTVAQFAATVSLLGLSLIALCARVSGFVDPAFAWAARCSTRPARPHTATYLLAFLPRPPPRT